MSLTHKLHREHTERLARWEAAAVPDDGIDLKRKPPEPPPALEPEPPPSLPAEEPMPLEPEPHGGPPDAHHIIRTVCVYFGTTPAVLASLQRSADIVRPRHICMYLLRKHMSLSLPRIGLLLGGFDHTSVMHGCRRIASLRTTNPTLDADVRKIEARLALLEEKQQSLAISPGQPGNGGN